MVGAQRAVRTRCPAPAGGGPPMSLAIILSAPDGEPIAHRITPVLDAIDGKITVTADRPRPHLWEPVVLLYVLSPGSLADAELAGYAKTMVEQGFPLVPIVEDRATFHFSEIPPAHDFLRNRNAV